MNTWRYFYMGRKAKYSKELKLKIIRRYLNGESSKKLANEYGISGIGGSRQVRYWVKQYQTNGEKVFNNKLRNNSYSREMKLSAIKEYLDGEGSLEEISNKYNISNHSILKKWVLKYNSHIEIEDYNPQPGVYMTKSRKITKDERMEIVKYCLENNKDYKKAAFQYGVNYSQVYSWVRKYLEFGEYGLEDNRGRKKSDDELSDFEKLKRENEKLRARTKYLEMENEVLKKLEELERREISERYKGKNTK